ncbi:GNAT family N-acetyltransferase [Actinoplanes sp. GCM10030250]|uniref:GNAT family N-acetyltransferase n=1 Tax=Actinoplanes sp. GCM10030250 TaxID=3273376 RepID=UPI00361E7627
MTSMTLPGVTLRPADSDDVAAVAAVWHTGWRDGHLGNVPASLEQHRRLDDFRRRVPARIAGTQVAVLGPRVIGFVMVDYDEIEQLFVAAEARGRGVADALLRQGEEMVSAGGLGRAWLAVASGNTRARRFYERMDWQDAGPIEYSAETATGSITVPCRRYERQLGFPSRG